MEKLSDECFAYAAMRKYPVHTKEAALKSHDQFVKEASLYGPATIKEINNVFDKAADFHGIAYNKIEKQASVQAEPLLFKGKSGDIAISKIDSDEKLHKSAAWLIEKRASSDRLDLEEAAKYVLWCGANMEADLNSAEMRKVACIAGIGVGDRAEIEHEFDKRATLNDFAASNSDFWAYSKDIKSLSDEDFYKEANLRSICNVMEAIDDRYDNKYRYGRDLKAPEDVVYGTNLDDLTKEASDLMYVPAIDATLSKKALEERLDKANTFFADHFGQKEALSTEKMVEKVASLDEATANALLEYIN